MLVHLEQAMNDLRDHKALDTFAEVKYPWPPQRSIIHVCKRSASWSMQASFMWLWWTNHTREGLFELVFKFVGSLIHEEGPQAVLNTNYPNF